MKNLIFAHTNFDAIYPGYVNISPAEEGAVKIIIRGDPTKRMACYICGYAKDKGAHGRCTPGDEHCNNYCNMAPEKGPMQKHPAPCEQISAGDITTLQISAQVFEDLKKAIADEP